MSKRHIRKRRTLHRPLTQKWLNLLKAQLNAYRWANGRQYAPIGGWYSYGAAHIEPVRTIKIMCNE